MSKHTFKKLMEQKKAEFRREVERRGIRITTQAEREREEKKREKEKEERERQRSRANGRGSRNPNNRNHHGGNRQHSNSGGRH